MSLTDDDKLWIAELLDQRLQAFESRMTERVEAVETKLLTAFHAFQICQPHHS